MQCDHPLNTLTFNRKVLSLSKILNYKAMKETRSEEILKMAILMEKQGKAFYEQVAKNTTNEEVANIFTIMAKEEQTHIEYLSEQFKYFKQNNKFKDDKLVAKNEADDAIANLIISGDVKKNISAAGYEAAAINAAIDMETKAINVYAKHAEEATDKNEKELFQWLSDWEKDHHKILNDLSKELQEEIWHDNSFWPF